MKDQWRPNLPEIHMAIVGANGSGKSALTVKYISRKFIGEYDPNLEDTYCKKETIEGRDYMIWLMDTVEGGNKDPNRYLSWADIFIVVYNITNRLSFEFAEKLLLIITGHEHSACRREHVSYLVGNKSDMERYRQISKSQGEFLAQKYKAEFFETNCTEQYALVKTIFLRGIEQVIASRKASRNKALEKAPTPRSHSTPEKKSSITTINGTTSSSDSDKSHHHSPNPFNRHRSRTKSPSAKSQEHVRDKNNSLPHKKSSPGLKLFKLFQ